MKVSKIHINKPQGRDMATNLQDKVTNYKELFLFSFSFFRTCITDGGSRGIQSLPNVNTF